MVDMVGVDEVGRGCLAGPLLVVAAKAVGELTSEVCDSKSLSRKQRESMLKHLMVAAKFGEGWVSPVEIDKRGLANALRLGLKRALEALNVSYDEEVIYDGPINYAPLEYQNVTCLIKADQTIPLVSAASIYAKVTRDRIMQELALKYPSYGFEHNVGYGTKAHQAAIEQFGPIRQLHRFSFSPFRQTELSL